MSATNMSVQNMSIYNTLYAPNFIGNYDILTNLINSPPLVNNFTFSQTTTELYIGFSFPTQYNVGFMPTRVPCIINTSINITYNINGNIKTVNIVDASSSNYIPSSVTNGTINTDCIQGIVLTKNSVLTTGYNSNYNGKKVYVYYNADFANMMNDNINNNILISCKNYNSFTTASQNFYYFITSGPPSAPIITNPAFTTNNMTFYLTTNIMDTTNPSDTTTYMRSYTIDSSVQTTSLTCYNSNTISSYTDVVSVTSNPYSFNYGSLHGNAYADCSYSYSITGTNGGSRVSNPTTITIHTLHPTQRTYTNDLLLSATNTIGLRVASTGNPITTNVYYVLPTITGNSRCSYTIGKTDTDHFITFTLGGANAESISTSINGFPLKTDTNVIGNIITLNYNTLDESTIFQNKGFWSYINYTIGFIQLVASSTLNTITSSYNTTQQFYYDSYSTPTINTHSESISTATTVLCGIKILNTPISVVCNVNILNAGNFFYASDFCTIGTTSCAWSDITEHTTNMTNINITKTITYVLSSYTKSINITYNSKNQQGVSALQKTETINVIYDPSIIISILNSISTTGSNGCRIPTNANSIIIPTYTSAIAYSPTHYFDSSSNTTLLTTDLLYANGLYRSYDSSYYTDYSSYYNNNNTNLTTISNNNYRWALFAWKFNTYYGNITFNIPLIGVLNIQNPNHILDQSLNPLIFRFKIEETTTPVYNSTSSNTIWIDMDSNLYNIGQTSTNWYSTSNNIINSTTTSTYTNGNLTCKATIPGFNTLNNTKNLYFLVGLPMASSITLGNIIATAT